MKVSIDEDYDSAILLLTKGDELHIRTTDNVSAHEFLELIFAVALELQKVVEQSDSLINRTIQ